MVLLLYHTVTQNPPFFSTTTFSNFFVIPSQMQRQALQLADSSSSFWSCSSQSIVSIYSSFNFSSHTLNIDGSKEFTTGEKEEKIGIISMWVFCERRNHLFYT